MEVDNSLSNTCWNNISKCINYYINEHNALYIDTPWIIPTEYRNMTYNGNDKFELLTNECLVGSAEQAFLYLEYNNKLEKNTLYISSGPCFRTEEKLDIYHREYFLKSELYYCCDKKSNNILVLNDILIKAFSFFETLIGSNHKDNYLKIINIENNMAYDIYLNDVEIGSYGIRNIIKNNKEKYYYIYGTALAEPRFTNILKTC